MTYCLVKFDIDFHRSFQTHYFSDTESTPSRSLAAVQDFFTRALGSYLVLKQGEDTCHRAHHHDLDDTLLDFLHSLVFRDGFYALPLSVCTWTILQENTTEATQHGVPSASAGHTGKIPNGQWRIQEQDQTRNGGI